MTTMTAHEVLDLISASESDSESQPQRRPAKRPRSVINDNNDDEDAEFPVITHIKQRAAASSDEDGAIVDESLVVAIHTRTMAAVDDNDSTSIGDSVNDSVNGDEDDDDDSHISLDSEILDATLELSTTGTSATTDTPATSATKLSKRKKAAVARYFAPASLSVKCYNCGDVGHMSAECSNAKVYPPCYICGHRSHSDTRLCPREACHRCGESGHQQRDCPNQRWQPRVCYRCGSTAHSHNDCNTPPSSLYWDLSLIHCYVCGKSGHINCTPPSFHSQSMTHQQCSNCASHYHHWSQCKSEKMMRDPPITEYNGDRRNGGGNYMQSMECYECGQMGHAKRDCPNRRQSRSSFNFVGRSSGANGARQSWHAQYSNNARVRDERSDRKRQQQRSQSREPDRGRSRERSNPHSNYQRSQSQGHPRRSNSNTNARRR